MNKIDHNDPLSKSADIVSENIQQLQQLFPEVFKEGKIDWQELQATLGEHIDTENERFNFTWNGKSNARKEAQKPSTGTLRPAPEESVDWDTTQNLYIEGDNLEVLKLLQKSYHQKIKLVYVDPPYNTGRDILYKNDFSDNLKNYLELTKQLDLNNNVFSTNTDANGRYHSNWLTMMYSRLKLSRNLLKPDGVFVIAIDHYELAHLIVLCNEIFGEENQLGIIAVVHKPEGRNQAKYFGTSHEYMLFYAKSKEHCNFRTVVLDEELLKNFDLQDDIGRYRLKNFIRMSDGKYSLRENKPKFYYPIYVSSDLKELSTNEKDGFTPVYPITESGQERTWKTSTETCQERIEDGSLIAVKEGERIVVYEKLRESQVIKTHWIDKKYHAYHFGTKVVDSLLENKTFDFPKSVYLVKDVLKLILEKNDTVLDFFSGSATTAHALMNLNVEDDGNRKHIMVQLPEPTDEKSEPFKAGYKTIPEIAKERIRRAGNKIKEEHPNKAKDLDLGFKVFKLDSSNIKAWSPQSENLEQNLLDAVENIKKGRTDKDLLFEILLKYGLDLTLPITEHEIVDAKVYNVGMGALLICLSDDITVAVAEGIAELKNKLNPEICRVVFKDNGFKDSAQKTNVMQKLKQHNIEEVRSI